MSTPKRKVLITGCSDGGMGAALAKEFHKAGLHVYATARDPSKMASLSSLGIETLALDIESQSSIEACVSKIPSLDILINNAGAVYTMPLSDLSISEAKKSFDLNVWAQIAMTQAFLPLLLQSKSKPIIANHTSVGAGFAIPWQGVYNASKAALASFTDTMRLELEGFGITVVELRTAGVKTNVINAVQAKKLKLPEKTIYDPVKDIVEEAMEMEWAAKQGIEAEAWAKGVAGDLLKSSPPQVIWRGESALMVRIGSLLPTWVLGGMIKKMTGVEKAEAVLKGR